MRLYTVFFCLFLSFYSFQLAAQSSGAFTVEIKDDYTKVLAPDKYRKQQNVVIKNQTLVEFRGRLESSDTGVLKHVAIPPKKYKAIDVVLEKGEKLKFLPLSPSLQAVELNFGKKSYEIPAQK